MRRFFSYFLKNPGLCCSALRTSMYTEPSWNSRQAVNTGWFVGAEGDAENRPHSWNSRIHVKNLWLELGRGSIFVSFCKHLMSTGTLCSQNNHSPNICCNNLQKVLANIILPVKNLLPQVLLCVTASQTLMRMWLPFEMHILHFSQAPRWCQCCRSPDHTLSSKKARWCKSMRYEDSHTSESSCSTSCLNILHIVPITPPTFPWGFSSSVFVWARYLRALPIQAWFR